MTAVRNVSGVDLFVPGLGPFGREVAADEVVEVPEDQVESYTCQPATWAVESITETAPAALDKE